MKFEVYYGKTVPFNSAKFKNWNETCAFIRAQLDNDNQVHSVHKIEKQEKSDEESN